MCNDLHVSTDDFGQEQAKDVLATLWPMGSGLVWLGAPRVTETVPGARRECRGTIGYLIFRPGDAHEFLLVVDAKLSSRLEPCAFRWSPGAVRVMPVVGRSRRSLMAGMVAIGNHWYPLVKLAVHMNLL